MNSQEELYAFQKYFIGQLQLDQLLEDTKIQMISNSNFVVEKVFELLANASESSYNEGHLITSESLHHIVKDTLSLQDCETFLYTF